jgi:hypothetical protein
MLLDKKCTSAPPLGARQYINSSYTSLARSEDERAIWIPSPVITNEKVLSISPRFGMVLDIFIYRPAIRVVGTVYANTQRGEHLSVLNLSHNLVYLQNRFLFCPTF